VRVVHALDVVVQPELVGVDGQVLAAGCEGGYVVPNWYAISSSLKPACATSSMNYGLSVYSTSSSNYVVPTVISIRVLDGPFITIMMYKES
jgi:hypothetical protein